MSSIYGSSIKLAIILVSNYLEDEIDPKLRLFSIICVCSFHSGDMYLLVPATFEASLVGFVDWVPVLLESDKLNWLNDFSI